MQQPTLFDETPATFYKTINLPADELRAARQSNNIQNTRVLAIFEKHPEGLTPFEAGGIYNGQFPEIPLTSVRRAVTDLENHKAKQSATKPKKAKRETAGLTGVEAIEARRKAAVLIGIDPGTHTGIAVKRHLKLEIIETLTIFEALNAVIAWKKTCDAHVWTMLVRIEDARQRTWFGKTDRERLKGAGSVERDCKIWEEVLAELKIPFEFVHPKNVKATTAEQFEKLTGWTGRTSIHAREAAWLII